MIRLPPFSITRSRIFADFSDILPKPRDRTPRKKRLEPCGGSILERAS
jgi:hypothetical protein